MIAAAVIGCGRMGAFTSQSVRTYSPSYWLPLSHADAFSLHPDVELRGFCDVDIKAAERARQAFKVPFATTDFHELLTEARPELLGVATRTVGRCDIIDAAVSAGVKAFHVEKPLCNTLDELDRLEALFVVDRIHVTLGTVRRFLDVFRVAKHIADSGEYGPIVEIRTSFGAGALYWSHPHSVDMILHMAGSRKIAGVQARLSNVEHGDRRSLITSDPIVDHAAIFFDDGVVGHIGRSPGFNLEISCAGGSITVVGDGPGIEILAAENGNPYPVRRRYGGSIDAAQPQGTFGPVSQLVSCLRGDATAIAENALIKADVVRGQRTLFAFMQSHLDNSALTELTAVDPALDIRAVTDGRFA